MIKEAEDNAEADKARKEEADLRNEADQLIFSADKAIEDLGDKVEESEKESINNAKDDLKTALEGSDLDAIKEKKKLLNKKFKVLLLNFMSKWHKNKQLTLKVLKMLHLVMMTMLSMQSIKK